MKLMEYDGPGEMIPEKDCQVTVGIQIIVMML